MSSTSNNPAFPIDFSMLKFSAPVLEDDEDSEEEEDSDYVDEHAFTKVRIQQTLTKYM
jgi:hypothetical protein